MTTLQTARLRLEPFRNSHFEELYYLNNDREVMRYITEKRVSIEETLAHMEFIKKNWAELGFSSWCLIELDTNEMVGSCGVQHIEFNPENPVEIGWRLKTSRWGQGYATEAARRVLQFVHDSTDIPEIYAVCHTENHRSAEVTHRLGMRFHGVERWYGMDTNVFRISRDQFLSGTPDQQGFLNRPAAVNTNSRPAA